MVYLNRIYTRAGDDGTTGLGDGTRVPKTHPRITAYGGVDELNAVLGLALTVELPGETADWLRQAQNDLFDLGADLCVPMSRGEGRGARGEPEIGGGRRAEAGEPDPDSGSPPSALSSPPSFGSQPSALRPPPSSGSRPSPLAPRPSGALRVASAQVDRLERWIDRVNAGLEPLTSFILPGGSAAAAHLHHARTVCRRVEIGVVALAEQEPINSLVSVYLNRLSDLLFVLARRCNNGGRDDVLWQPGAGRDANF